MSAKAAGIQRQYTEEQLALFARYRDVRASCAPQGCTRGERCWVEAGPPCIDTGSNVCIGCRKTPRSRKVSDYDVG